MKSLRTRPEKEKCCININFNVLENGINDIITLIYRIQEQNNSTCFDLKKKTKYSLMDDGQHSFLLYQYATFFCF